MHQSSIPEANNEVFAEPSPRELDEQQSEMQIDPKLSIADNIDTYSYSEPLNNASQSEQDAIADNIDTYSEPERCQS